MKLVSESVLDWFRGRTCELCGKGAGEPHHIYTRGMGGGGRIDHPFNLISVCRLCHTKIHNGNWPGGHLAAVAANREGVSKDCVFDFIAWIRRQPKERPVGW